MVIRSKITFRHTEKIGIIMLLYSFLYFDDSMITLNSIEPKVLSNFGTALILLSNEKSYINNFLSNKAFKVVGLTSYSLYLFHQPLFAFEKIFLEKYSISNSDFFKFSIFVVLFLFSYFNWKYIEVYFQKVEFKVLIKSIVILILIFVIFIYASSYTNGFENRFSFVPEEVLYYATNPNIYPNTFESTDYVFQNVNCENYILSNKYCIYFNTFNDKTIYLIGDSQTNSLSVSFLQEFKEISNTYNLVFFSGPAGRCILSMQSDTLGYVPECSEEFFNAFTDILNKNSDLVIAFGRFDTWLTNKGNNELKCTECSHIETFRSRIEKISQNSHRFYLIEPIPTYKFGIANSYLYKKTKWGEAITQDIKTRDQQLLLTNSFIETIGVKNLSYISTTPLFCDKNYCYASSVDQIYYSDTNHLTLEGALKISELLKTIISKLE